MRTKKIINNGHEQYVLSLRHYRLSPVDRKWKRTVRIYVLHGERIDLDES